MRAFARKLSVLISVNHAVMLAYRAEIYLWVLAHVLPFLMMGLWAHAARTHPAAGYSMTPLEYKRYFLAVFAVRQFSAVWMIYMFEWEMIEGRLSNYMLKPAHPFWYYVAGHLGEQIARFPFFLVMVGLYLAVDREVLFSLGLAFILLGAVMTYAGFALRFALQWCFAMLSFWFERASSIETLSFMPYVFLSGLAIPMGDFPPALRSALLWTPFPYMVSFPARVMTGAAGPSEILTGLAAITLWFLLFFALGALLWRRGLYKYAGQGA